MTNNHFIKIMAIYFIIAMLPGCTMRSHLNPSFWENKTSRIAVGVIPYPIEGHVYVQSRDYFGASSYTLPDKLSDPGLTDFVHKFDYSKNSDIKSLFINELTKRGMQTWPLDDESLNQTMLRVKKYTKEEALKILREQTNADLLLIFRVNVCGVYEREGILPWIIRVKRPIVAVFNVSGYLINLRNGEVEWRYQIRVPSEGKRVPDDVIVLKEEWNEPPNYPNIDKAIREAIKLTTTELYKSFFQ